MSGKHLDGDHRNGRGAVRVESEAQELQLKQGSMIKKIREHRICGGNQGIVRVEQRHPEESGPSGAVEPGSRMSSRHP